MPKKGGAGGYDRETERKKASSSVRLRAPLVCGCKPWGIIWHRVLLLLICHSARGSPAHLSRGPAVTVLWPKITPANGGEERQRSQSIGVINDIAGFLQANL